MLRYKKIIIICFLAIYGLTLAQPIFAADWLVPIIGRDSLIPGSKDTGCRGTGACTLSDFIRVAIALFRLMLGLLGSLALLFFTYGGVIMILSRGSQTMVQRGKSILTQALIGIMIVLGSWLIVNLVIVALTGTTNLFNSEWWNPKWSN